MELESHVVSTGLASSGELVKEENATTSTEQELRPKIPSSKQICPTSHSGMVLKQPQGFQDAF